MSWQISCGFKNLDKLGVRIKKIKNTLKKTQISEKNKKNPTFSAISKKPQKTQHPGWDYSYRVHGGLI